MDNERTNTLSQYTDQVDPHPYEDQYNTQPNTALQDTISASIAEQEVFELSQAIKASQSSIPIKINTRNNNNDTTSTSTSTSTQSEQKDSSGFFYIIQTADVPYGVYKIGKTTRCNPNKRLCEYPKFSSVKYTIFVNDCHGFESYTMRKFRVLFKRRREFGLEYYEGDIKQMINAAHKLWNKFGNSSQVVVDKSVEKIKPIGFQYFINEWYADQVDPSIDEAYDMYVSIIQSTFMSNEYANKQVFVTYLNHILS